MIHDEVKLRCEVALAGNTTRRLWSLRSGLPISKKKAELEAKMQKQKNEQPRIDFSGLGSTDNLHQETEVEFKHSSISDELLLYHKRSALFHFSRLYEMPRQGTIPSACFMRKNQHVLPAYMQRRPDGAGEAKVGRIGQATTVPPHQDNAYLSTNSSPQPLD